MLTIYDYIEKANQGPLIEEKKYDLLFAKSLRAISKKYQDRIQYDESKVICDGDTADAIFEAGVELLSTVGMYHIGTQRMIPFTKEEALEIAATRPSQLIVGAGKEQRTIVSRTPQSTFGPLILSGPAGGAINYQYYKPCLQSFAQEWGVDGMLGGVLPGVHGMETVAGQPSELIASIAEMNLEMEACRDAGRPGLWLGCVPAGAVNTDAIIGAVTATHLEPQRGQIPIGPLPEGKLHWGFFKLAIFAQTYGMPVWNTGGATIGALARNAVEAAIARVAVILGETGLTNGESCTVWSPDVHGILSARRNYWAISAVTQAMSRHVGIPTYLLGYALAGPCTEMSFLETAAYSVAFTCCGGSVIWGGATSNGMAEDKYAGIYSRVCSEVSKAVTGMETERANEIIDALFQKYEADLTPERAPAGKTFAECYNLDTLQPTTELNELYLSCREKLKDEFGIYV